MDNFDQAAAPGCYGIGLIYSADAVECKSCPFATRCGPLSIEQLGRIRAELGIPEPKAPPNYAAKVKDGLGGQRLIEGLPKKVMELVESIDRAGIRVVDALRQGINPFETKFAFMKITCHLLLHPKMKDGVPRDVLRQAFMSKLDNSAGTADARVIQAMQTLKALGAVDYNNGVIRLRRS